MAKIDFYNEDGLVPVSISSAIYNSLIDMIDEYAIYLSKNFGIRKYFDNPDPRGLDCSNACNNLDKEKFYRRLKAQVGQALSDNFEQNLYASEDSDVPIIVFANIAEFICSELYDAVYRGIDETGRKYYYFEENASRDRQLEFIDTLNQILERNSLPFQLDDEGHFKRKIDEEFQSIIAEQVPSIEVDIDTYIHQAKEKILSCEPNERQIAIEKLWDAFERLKTYCDGSDKKETTTKLVDNSFEEQPVFKGLFAKNMMEYLTKLGNDLQIRHSETNKEKIKTDSQVDYLFRIMLTTLNFLIFSNTK